MKPWIWLWVLLLAANARADWVGRHEGASELLLSGNGKVAFSSGAGGTRVWDIESKRELAALPVHAGSVVAVAEDGGRILCRRSIGDAEQNLTEFALWWSPYGVWQKGTQVRDAAVRPLLDATFVDGEVVLLWEQSVERYGTDGRLRRIMYLKEISKWPYVNETPTGALSRDGLRAVVSGYFGEQLYGVIYDTLLGRPLTRTKIASFSWYSAWEFSPNAKVVGAIIGEWVGPWGPNDGPQPAQFTRSLWNVRTGDELNHSYNLSLTFWPKDGRTLLVEISYDAPWKLELYDISAKKTSPLPFPQPWKERALIAWRFSRDGKTLALLDEKGDIWVERELISKLS